MEYQSRVTRVDAFQFGVGNYPEWFKSSVVLGIVIIGLDYGMCLGDGRDGQMVRTFKKGDYILKTEDGRIYPCEKDIFEARYEKVKE